MATNVLCLVFGCGAAEVVERDVEPLVDLFVHLVVLVADLLRSDSFLQGLVLRRCPVLVCAADEQTVVAHRATIPEHSKHFHVMSR